MRLSDILNYKNKIIHTVIIIFAIIVASNLYKSQTRGIESLKEKKELEIKKIRVLGDINELTKLIKVYKDLVNKKDISSTINRLSRIANDSDIDIVTISPGKEQVYPLYIKYPFQLVVRTKYYDNIGKFISKLESSPDVYIIDSAQIRSAESRETRTTNLVMDLTLSTIILR